MKWQTHYTADKLKKRRLSLAEQLTTNQLIVKIEEWDANSNELVTFGEIVIDPLTLVSMVYAAEGVK